MTVPTEAPRRACAIYKGRAPLVHVLLLVCVVGLGAYGASRLETSARADWERRIAARAALRAPPEWASVSRVFEGFRQANEGADDERAARVLAPASVSNAPLSFDPLKAIHFPRIAEQLALSEAERAVYAREGLVVVQRDPAETMPTAYYAIALRNLPVLVTTDSILHAVHRALDGLLADSERYVLADTLAAALEAMHEELEKAGHEIGLSAMAESADDLDVYLAVARTLVAISDERDEAVKEARVVATKRDTSSRVEGLLAAVARGSKERTEIWGGRRHVDFSQLGLRGHYRRWGLAGYFRAQMWLSRPDVGFVVSLPARADDSRVDPDRELRDAALFALLARRSHRVTAFEDIDGTSRYVVRSPDGVGVRALADALDSLGIHSPRDLLEGSVLQRLREHLRSLGGPTLRSFQPLGSGFRADDFLLSRMLANSIDAVGQGADVGMASTLDLMAIFGNREALRLLPSSLDDPGHGASLLAARKTFESIEGAPWMRHSDGAWLDVLDHLNAELRDTRGPSTLARPAWERKMLNTLLGSWVEYHLGTTPYMRGAEPKRGFCDFPLGYVEPYPELFARLRDRLKHWQATWSTWMDRSGSGLAHERRHAAAVVKTLSTLERSARNEQRGEALAAADMTFLRRLIRHATDEEGIDYFDGWYVGIGVDQTIVWDPQVGPVHTDLRDGATPGSHLESVARFVKFAKAGRRVEPRAASRGPEADDPAGGAARPDGLLQAGLGAVKLLVAAIPVGQEVVAFVGPVYGYYEFRSDRALTNSEWRRRLQSAPPPAPSWLAPLRAPADMRAR